MSNGKKLSYEDILNTFFTESRERLEDMEASLLELEKNREDQESLNAVFRAAHTIKGSAGMFGFDDIGNFSHALENLLADLRDRKLSYDHELGALLFECHDFMLKLIEFYDANRQGKIDKPMLEALIHLQLKLSLSQKKTASGVTGSPVEEKKAPEEEQQIGKVVENMCWHISLRFGESTFRDGFDPQSFISYLGNLGKVVNLRMVHDSMPPLKEFNAENCYLGFEIDFMGDIARKKLEDVFEFVKDDCKVRILPPRSNISEYVELINDLPESPMTIGKILVEAGSLTSEEVDEALRMQSEKILHHEKKLLGEIFVDEKMVHQPVLDEALKKQMKVKKSMRVDTEKLDSLINLVGELVIATASIKQIADRLGSMDLEDSVSSLSMLMDNLRGSSMNLRMVQIGDSFKRFERAVHDLSNAQGKQVDLALKGGETEVDKTLVEKIMDPLMHIVRNAVDHGIDTPDKRAAAGKPPRGRIAINAYSEAGSVVIEVSDDGNGLNRSKILAKAVEQGLIDPEEGAKLSESDLSRFVFMPGFSTAEKITDISGRGVGMDVVMRNVDSLRGTVSIKSTEGQGATVALRLPLTLVIIDGFMVKSGAEVYLLPLDMVNECAEISVEEIMKHENGNFMNLRGELVPFIRLRDFFNIPGESPGKEFIVIAEYFGKKAGIVVDKPLGEMQIVGTPLGNIFNSIRWLSGATILGGGDPALILDIPRLIQYVQASQQSEIG
jgi:two-component system chemotaxis sensor kinase CheA